MWLGLIRDLRSDSGSNDDNCRDNDHNGLDSLEETLTLLSDSEALRELAPAQRAVAEGDVVRGVDEIRALRPHTPG